MGAIEGRLIEGRGFRGVIFPEDAAVGPSAPGGHWTPTDADIVEAERHVRQQLASLVAAPAARPGAAPRLAGRLAEYRRQYVGLRGESAEQSIWINFFAAPDDRHPDWTRTRVSVSGGGEDYFQLVVDMDAFTCRELRINPAS